MNFIFEGRPSDSPFVERVWQTRTETDGGFISSASTQWEMVVVKYQGQTSFTIRGPETKASPVVYPPDYEFFGITFKLGTFMPHLPAKTIMDRNDLVLPEASHQSFWFDSAAWQFPTFDNADTFLSRLAHRGMLMHDPLVQATLEGQPLDLSPRAVQYRFLHATGLTHSTVRQIERAERAATLLEQGVSILDTVYETGYFDQAHLTRSLKRFHGQTPTQIARSKSFG